MGRIIIKIEGSFKDGGVDDKQHIYSAETHGHADAVSRAIEHLSRYVLPKATALDHKLHEEGHKPDGGFERPKSAGFSI